jgi:hypothetical protein
MNEKIANILRTRIQNLNFVDKISGMVHSITMDILDKDNKSVKKVFPVSTDITADQCKTGRYQDLVPNSKYNSIIYFEDGGTGLSYKAKNRAYFSSKLILVCWLNLKKLQECNINVISDQCILAIVAQMPEFPISDGIYREINIKAISETVKSSSIFGKYSYDETINQYLLWPFDYFSLQFNIEFWVNLSCVEQLNISECTC